MELERGDSWLRDGETGTVLAGERACHILVPIVTRGLRIQVCLGRHADDRFACRGCPGNTPIPIPAPSSACSLDAPMTAKIGVVTKNVKSKSSLRVIGRRQWVQLQALFVRPINNLILVRRRIRAMPLIIRSRGWYLCASGE